ncbi:MAG TPA: excinuclease ABC subunit UvrA [Chlamydiales bacterium]|nr:excinuclease ABC subunit UvrA [Chlamydiales bacterium]
MIVLKNVRVHNLKGVDLELETGQLVVFTGVSGSGKSSLAFDTIYVEGQRRYIESLSHQARRFLGDLPKPDAESITGISPTIAIEQKTAGRTPRSTVGTMTGIYDFLRVLYARIGIPHCPISKEPVAAQSREKIVAQVENLGAKKMVVLAPFARGKKGEFREEFAELLSKGFMRLRVDGAWVELGEIEELDPKIAHDVDIVVDRLTAKDTSRISEAVNSALELGKGFFSIWNPDTEEETIFSQFAHSVKSGLSYGPLEPHDFSFNHPTGMCPTCHGLGFTAEFDLTKVIDPNLSISEDCCHIGSSYQTVRYGNIYDNLARLYKFSIKKAWKDLPAKAKEVFLHGTEQKWTRMYFVHPVKKTRWYEYVQWKGVLSEARERLNAAKSDTYRKNMAELMTEGVCPSCHGSRIKPYPAATELGGKKIAELTAMPLSDALLFLGELKLSKLEMKIAGELLKEIRERLQFLIDVGLSYISLDRTSPTLSGGEAQRVRLASQIGAGLVGAIYVLDEPSIGLHPIDHHKLIDTLKRLRDQGNTVLVVEHDADTIASADRVVDVGPGAGQHGGEILSLDDPRSLTGGYLSGRLKFDIPKKRRKAKEKLTLKGATHNNLKNLTVSIPLGVFVCVTGVSGSGKSSLIDDTLYPELVKRSPKLKGLEHVDKVIAVDQSPIGRTPRSNAATYIKLFDEIRDLFTELPESKLRGFHSGHFSFNVKEGSCSYCGGLGQVRIDMDFMEDAWVECPQCKGKRFDPEILSVKFKGKSIHDVLETDVEHALALFDAIPSIRRKLEVLSQVGLDYLTLGQPSTTLSGGEAQRIKLAKELVRPATGKTIYILDEPTTGLHFHDIKRLIAVLQQLVDKGNTVLVIEHNMDLVKCADWVIDLGPGAGIYGGTLIGEGTPEEIAKLKTPTGLALKGLPPSPKKARKPQIVEEITVEKASQNNLREVSLKIPRGKITVFTGPSGSGKSSLAFDTLYAEGQRRYTETLPAYSRALVKQLPKPKVEKIEGLSPSIALEQKTGGLNPRSTVGTITEVYDLLRVLYAHLGVIYDPETGKEIENISKETIVSRILSLPRGEKVQILTQVAFQKKETFEELTERLNREGFLRIRLNGKTYQLDEEIPYEKHRKNEIFLSLDRLAVDPKEEKRLYEAIELAQEGVVIVAKENEDMVFNLSTHRRLTPQTFSFNHDAGMCLECQGLGITYGAHLENHKKLKKLSIFDIVDRLFKDKGTSGAYKIVEKYFDAAGENLDTILNGGPEVAVKKGLTLRWLGLHSVFANAARMANSEIRESLLPMMQATTCSACKGTRLNPTARNVRINGISLPDLCALSIEKAYGFIETLQVPPFLKETHSQIAKFLEFLLAIGLRYLALDRSAPTLSGGELQRIRLARQLGSGLTSCLYILDEPTIGLHPFNNELLNSALKDLRDLGNTLILVEHDPMTIRTADYLFDFGPKAGHEGGHITAHGTIPQILKDPHSLTGAYLSGRKKIPIPTKRRPFHSSIRIENATLHNLKNITVEIPKASITCLTGVSGSGKSSLMSYLKERKEFDKIITIDQSPIGQTSRADVSTYTDIQPLIRAHYASLPLSLVKGLQPRHFSPNHIRGMCRTCWGLGYKTVDLQFLPSVRVTCDACHGQRLNPISLEVRYKGKHLGEVLQMSVDVALEWFSAIPRIVKRLEKLVDVGLPYLHLGQELASLSGGEAQRLRLSRELSKRETGNTLYLIDEPTVGLHPEDVLKLLKIFHQLADSENTLVIIEHNLDVIVNADYLIDLGPDAGDEGGHIMATGTPEEVARSKTSRTAKYIREML